MDELYQPFWVEGTFKVENASSGGGGRLPHAGEQGDALRIRR